MDPGSRVASSLLKVFGFGIRVYGSGSGDDLVCRVEFKDGPKLSTWKDQALEIVRVRVW